MALPEFGEQSSMSHPVKGGSWKGESIPLDTEAAVHPSAFPEIQYSLQTGFWDLPLAMLSCR
jgi:hypothetical protein